MKIALDSNCLSYLIDACEGKQDIDPSIGEEGLALIRIWLYLAERYYISMQVLDECLPIGDHGRRKTHLAFANATYFGIDTKDSDMVAARADEFSHFHSGKKDCRVLAEAEDMGVDILLSYDGDFINHLGKHVDGLSVMRPSAYWQSVQLPHGTVPKLRPHESNPLASETFWRW